jgi:short-subunit dehydrogenase
MVAKIMPGRAALLIGNTDGIGLALANELLSGGWTVLGISRSESPVRHQSYEHVRADVQDDTYPGKLESVLDRLPSLDLCVYCAGIGVELDVSVMEREVEVFNVNLLGMVKTATVVIPRMVMRGVGHFIGLSSMADILVSPEAPSYYASKAGFSNYLEGLAIALKPNGVYVTNVRFGFVRTKMARSAVTPFMMDADRAARHLLVCIKRKPIRYTAPWIMIPLVRFFKWWLRLKALFARRPRKAAGDR